MRRGWGRWRGYAEELEELMRVAGEHLAEAERLIAEAWERPTWHPRQRDSIDEEMLRRALDVPFLGDVVRTALRLAPGVELTPPDFVGEPWQEEGAAATLTSTQRASGRGAVQPVAPCRDEQPPARLRAAERALRARTRSLVVVLDDLVSARNASAVVRTAEALGLQEVHHVQREGRVALERTVTMQAERWLDLHWYARAEEAIAGLRERDYAIWVADYAEGAVPLGEVPVRDRLAIVFGSEQSGVSQSMRAAADGFFYMPTAGFTSYVNVSVMAGIAIHDVDARMRAAGVRRPLDAEDLARVRRGFYSALARGSDDRARRYLGWLEHEVEPAPPRGASAGRRGLPVVDSVRRRES